MTSVPKAAVTEAYERRGEQPGTWATERINQPEGDIDLVVFHGRDSERRAREYAAWDNARYVVGADVARLTRNAEPSPTWPCPRCGSERDMLPACIADNCPILDGDGRVVEPTWRTVAEP